MKQRTQNLSVTIGIPAYNEEQNIAYLIKSILKQRIRNGKLQEILVVSDGSTDRTVDVLSKIRNKKFRFIIRKKRTGLNGVQNEIVKQCKADILILLDADVLPEDNSFIDKMIEPLLIDRTVGLVGGHVDNVEPQTRIEEILSYGQEFKRVVFQNIRNGDNVYLCHGRVRAFRKEFYSNLSWPDDVPEDAYSYIVCRREGFRFVYVRDAVALFRLPATISDYIKQTKRFEAGKQALYAYFSKGTVASTYRIPLQSLLRGLVASFKKNPLSIASYLVLRFYVFHINKEKITHDALYDVPVSTKNLFTRNIFTR